MSTPERTPGTDAQGYPSIECSLGSLKSRSQIDFEVDFFERILSRDPGYVEVLCNLGELFSIKGWSRRALQVDKRLAQLRPRDPLVLYNLACSYALLQRADEAVATLRRAVEAGYRDFDHLEQDPDLDGIRPSPEFIQFMKELVDTLSKTRSI
jgi:tetratricopeptide (TPR) repeat protein